MEEGYSKREARQAALGRGKDNPAARGNRFAKDSNVPARVSPDARDLDRILELPIQHPFDEQQVEEFSRSFLLASAFDEGKRLLGPQARAIAEFLTEGAGFFPIGVGFGKTGTGISCAELAYRAGCRTSLIIVPPQVYGQLVNKDLGFWRAMISLSVPVHRLGGVPIGTRRAIAKSRRQGVYIMPYSLLSTADTMELLEGIDPDLIIADEVHNLKNHKAARTRRLMGWVREREAQGRPVFLVAMSGTITNKSLDDYHHLISWALRERSPLPKSHSMALSWGALIDSGSSFTSEHQAGPLRPLVKWAYDNFPEHRPFTNTITDFRRAFKLRLKSSPGVVGTADEEVGTSLSIEEITTEREPNDELVMLTEQAKEMGMTPNGDPIEHQFHIYKWLSELTAGFYNLLLWPDEEHLLKKFKTAEKAGEALDLGKHYHRTNQRWSKEVRKFCDGDAPLGLDTPLQIAKYISLDKNLGILPSELLEPYYLMKEIKRQSIDSFGTLVERIGQVCRVDDYKIKAAVKWAMETTDASGEGCILWYHHNAVGDWLRDYCQDAGLDVLYACAGENDGIVDEANAGKVVVASMNAHGTGKNLQHFGSQLFVQWPRHAPLAEQTLGRTHRTGQLRDELIAYRLNATMFDSINFAACLNDAVYIHQSTGQRQKLVYARYEPLPKIFSPEFLKEQGADPKALNPQQRNMMLELFGEKWEEL